MALVSSSFVKIVLSVVLVIQAQALSSDDLRFEGYSVSRYL